MSLPDETAPHETLHAFEGSADAASAEREVCPA